MNLTELKKRYGELAVKYKLPSFTELNEDFEIERIRKGEDMLLRTVRKTMTEKIVNSMNFMELMLNPMNAPRMYLVYIKSITADDKKEIEGIYSVLSDIVLGSLKLEINYSEKDEIEMIKRIAKDWNSVKPAFIKIVEKMQKPGAAAVSKEKSYFG